MNNSIVTQVPMYEAQQLSVYKGQELKTVTGVLVRLEEYNGVSYHLLNGWLPSLSIKFINNIAKQAPIS